MGLDRWVRVSILSILRALLRVVAASALLAVLFLLLGLHEIAVPFLLSAAIGLGLVVVATIWRLLTRAHPDSS